MEYLIQKQTLDDIGDAVRSVSEDPALIPVRNLAAEIRGLSSLNFRVLGGTEQPENPRENDIWVQTDTAISGWEISSVEPAGAEGAVWIAVGMESQVAFNAVKKNVLAVYPLEAMQHTGGAWTPVGANIYRSGAWVQFSGGVTTLYLFNNGEYSDVTGGWVGSGKISGNTLDISNWTGYNWTPVSAHTLHTVNPIKLTGYTTLTATLATRATNCFVGLRKTVDGADEYLLEFSTIGTKKLSIEGIRGEYFVYLYGKENGGAQGGASAGGTFSSILVE